MAVAPLPMHVRRNFWIGIDRVKKHADLDPLELSKKAKHEAEWFCHQHDVGLLIHFPEPDGKQYRGSPFADSEFYVPSAGSVLSGPPLETAEGTYKYDVYVIDPKTRRKDATPLLDPQIIIKD